MKMINRMLDRRADERVKEVRGISRVTTTLRLPEELKEQLHREATEMGFSFNTYVLTLIYKARQDQQKSPHESIRTPRQTSEE